MSTPGEAPHDEAKPSSRVESSPSVARSQAGATRAAVREERTESERLDLILRIMLAMLAVWSVGTIAMSFSAPEEHDRTIGIFGLIAAAAGFVRWSSLPFLAARTKHPGSFLALVSKGDILFAIVGTPILLKNGAYLGVALVAVVTVASVGLWFRWEWVGWVWFALLLAGGVGTLVSAWDLFSGELDTSKVISLVKGSVAILMWLAFAFEILDWYRSVRAERNHPSA